MDQPNSAALDVAVSFNEIDPAVNPEYLPKLIAGRSFGFVEQVAALGRSLRRNMPAATLWAVHTTPLSTSAAAQLEAIGWNVVEGKRAAGPHVTNRLNDRLAAYELGQAPQLLLLDADSIVVAPVALATDRPVRVGYAGNPVFDRAVWRELYGLVGVEHGPPPLPRAFDLYFHTGIRIPTPFFNNGAVLVDRAASAAFVARMRDAAAAILGSGIIDRVDRIGHYLDQICLSLAVRQTKGWGLLPRGFNALGPLIDLDRSTTRRRVSHYHYLGSKLDTSQMERFYGRFFADG